VDPACTHLAWSDAVAEALDGEWHERSGRHYLIIDRTYPPGHRHGRTTIADAAPGDEGWRSLAVLDPAMAQSRLLFVDLETTGLAGGAGTCAFLVGCAWFDGAVFRVRQLLLARYAGERALLEDVARVAGEAGGLATYNGKTFDVPLIETRFLFHRMTASFSEMPHVDLLPTARRLWRPADADRVSLDATDERGAGCRLSAVEQSVLGHAREGDVPGFEIPSRYFHFVRSGDPRPLAAVLEHNRQDLLSLALLTARAAMLLEQGACATTTAREAFGLGCLYRRGGMRDEALACFARAVEMGEDDPGTTAEALRECAVLSRRARRYEEAAAAWRQILELGTRRPRLLQEASEALAVHHEHRDANLALARDLAQQSLRHATSTSRAHAVRHRLTRLNRKMGNRSSDQEAVQPAASLF
jgi:uncharacterized protein YprB with RNaseH-like and TPR domain